MKKPLNTRQQRFCEFIAAGESQTEAYIKAGFNVTRPAARRNAARLLTNADIKERISALREPQTKRALRRKEDNLRFLAACIEATIGGLDPDSPLCVEYIEERIVQKKGGKKVSGQDEDGTEVIRRKVKKPDPLRAIELYSRLLGHFEPDRTEIDVGQTQLISIRERAAQVGSALARRYGGNNSAADATNPTQGDKPSPDKSAE